MGKERVGHLIGVRPFPFKGPPDSEFDHNKHIWYYIYREALRILLLCRSVERHSHSEVLGNHQRYVGSCGCEPGQLRSVISMRERRDVR